MQFRLRVANGAAQRLKPLETAWAYMYLDRLRLDFDHPVPHVALLVANEMARWTCLARAATNEVYGIALIKRLLGRSAPGRGREDDRGQSRQQGRQLAREPKIAR